MNFKTIIWFINAIIIIIIIIIYNHLLTKSEVITGKSQTEALMY